MSRRILRHLLNPFRTGWPDQARAIVQAPIVANMLDSLTFSRHSRLQVLNAGSGEGLYSPLLLKLTCNGTVIELDPAYAVRNPRKLDERQMHVAGTLTSLPLQSGWANLVICSEVLEHIEDDRRAIAEIVRVTAPGGHILITVPTPPAAFDPAHVREGYLASELGSLLCDAGLRVLLTRHCMFGFFRFIMKWWRVVPWIPRPVLWTLSYADRHLRLGPPMDLLLLCVNEAA
ncbi:MAG: methyltransferase domain-containing protein [Anaerolineae bacterium]|nr:methyltransferase domain-containing protein [Phycisphaerae bacterium]